MSTIQGTRGPGSINSFIPPLFSHSFFSPSFLLYPLLLYSLLLNLPLLIYLPFHFIFKIYFIDYAIIVASFFLPFILLCPIPHPPPSLLHLSSCPWVIHICSLASPYPLLFLTSPCLFSTYHLCFLFPVPFPAFFPFPHLSSCP